MVKANQQNLFLATFKMVFSWVFLILTLAMLVGAAFVLKPFLENHSNTLAQQVLDVYQNQAQKEGIEKIPAPELAETQISWLPFNIMLSDKLAKAPEISKATIYPALDGSNHYWVKLQTPLSSTWIAFHQNLIGTKPILTLSILLGLLVLTSGLVAWILATKQKKVYQQLAREAVKIGQSKQPVMTDSHYDIVEVQAMFDTLQQLSETLNRAEQDKAILLAGISHDLRTPITRLYLQLALQESQLESQFIKEMELELQQLEQLIELFLDHSQVHYQAKAVFHKIELHTWLQQLIHRYNQPNRIQLLHHSEKLFIPLNEPVLARVCQNLLDNALKHTTGKIEISIEQTRTNSNKKHKLIISIRDYGQQISSEQFTKLQHPYSQANPNTQGSGLGLNIIQYLCQQQNWQCRYTMANPGIKANIIIPAFN